MIRYVKIMITSALLMMLSSGCMTNGEFNFIERSIKKEIYPSTVRTKFKFSFGAISMSTARSVVRLADADEEALNYLNEIDKAQIGVYEIEHREESADRLIPHDVEERLNRSGYHIFVRVRERGENVNLYFKEISDSCCGLYCIVIDNDELVIVEVQGRLDKLIEEALNERSVPGRGV